MSSHRREGESSAGVPLQALLWDVDGTLAETELDGHRQAFNRAFAEEGLRWHWDVDAYLQLLRISGGRERMRAYSRQQGDGIDGDQIERLQSRKQHHYGQLLRDGAVRLRPGVRRLIRECQQAGVRQGIVTTSGRAAVQALISNAGAELEQAFSFWICGEDVRRKKPDPEGYQLALARLRLASDRVLVIEDSRNGLEAATAAGLACLVTLSASSSGEAEGQALSAFRPALAVLDGLGEPGGTPRSLGLTPCPNGPVTLSWLQSLRLAP